MVRFKTDVCNYLRLPDIPKKKWDGQSSFEHGVGIADTKNGEQVYVTVSFDAEKDKEPRIMKTFGYDIINKVVDVFVVPSYMDDSNIEKMDLDEESKKRVAEIAKEAKEIENEGVAEKVTMPESEYFFDHIHDDNEARAFIESYNKKNKIKGSIPRKHEALVMRLGVIWAETNKQN